MSTSKSPASPPAFNPADVFAIVRDAVRSAYQREIVGKHGAHLDAVENKGVQVSTPLRELRVHLQALGVASSETASSKATVADTLNEFVLWLKAELRDAQAAATANDGSAYVRYRAAFNTVDQLRAALIRFGINGGCQSF